MPIPARMAVRLTEAELRTINDALNVVKTTLLSKITVNLTKEERSGGQSVAEKRLPYVQMTFDDFVTQFSQLQPGYMSFEDANLDYTFMQQLDSIELTLRTLAEILGDQQIAAGILAYQYMREFYLAAQRARERNVPGADTVVDALSPLFTQENEAPPAPPTV